MSSHGIVTLATDKSSLAETKHGESASSSGVYWWTAAGGRGLSAGSIVCCCSLYECVARVIGSPGQPNSNTPKKSPLKGKATGKWPKKLMNIPSPVGWVSYSFWSCSCVWEDAHVGVALVRSLHWSQMERARESGAGMGQQVKAFTCNSLLSHRDPWRPRECLCQRGVCLGSKTSSLW